MEMITLKKDVNISFRNRIATIEDVSDIAWIEKDVNAKYNETTWAWYFNFDAVKKINKAYQEWLIKFYVPSIDQRNVSSIITWRDELQDHLGIKNNWSLSPEWELLSWLYSNNLWASTDSTWDWWDCVSFEKNTMIPWVNKYESFLNILFVQD